MTWRPYLDLQIVQSRRFSERGIPRYATELSRTLLDRGVPVAGLALNPHLPFPTSLPPELTSSPRLTWNTAGALRRACEEGPTLYHLLAPYEPSDLVSSWLPGNVIRGRMPLVITVYDLIPELMGLFGRGTRAERFYRIRSRLLARADLLLALSEQTRRDVIEHSGVSPDRVVVVGAGSSEFFRAPVAGESPARLVAETVPAIDRPYVFTVSAWEIRKNTELLIDAFAALPSDLRSSLQLVVACKLPPEGEARWTERARHHGLGERDVVLTGFVPDAALRALYQEAQLFVYPSRYEGFGLPVLEAARCGAPAIVADAPGLQEVLEWPPATFSPDDVEGLAALIERGLTDAGFRARLLDVARDTAARHTWDRVAQRTIEGYERLEPRARFRSAQLPRRLALVGPFPPLRSGIARYDAEVAARLAEHCELDCFVDAGDWDHPDIRHEARPSGPESIAGRRPFGARARYLPARALGRRVDPARYDAIVYVLGDSWFHHDTLAAARRFPGIAWFHDVDLTGLYVTYAHRLLDRDAPEAVGLFRDLLERYGPRAPRLDVTTADTAWATYEPYRRSSLRFTLELARSAAACVVTSSRARALLEFDAGPASLLPPVHVLPLAIPAWAGPAPDGGELPAEPPVVVSVGRQDLDAKQPGTVLEGFAKVAATREARLAVIGVIRPELREQLERHAAALGLGDRVDVTGYLPEREYRRRVTEARCAVQLRRPSTKGEGSAALGDVIAAGLPVITNVPAAADLPAGTVQRVPVDAGAAEIAQEIARVLDDDTHGDRLREGARAFARTWSFEDVTAALLEIVDESRAGAWRAQPQSA